MNNKSLKNIPFIFLIVTAAATVLYYTFFRKSPANFAINLDY
jgi:hypothetical protein